MTNTGEQSGTIRLLELSLKKPLQWSICLLHLNEIIIRHIIERVDGPNIGPETYTGDVGKAICSMSKDPQKHLTKSVSDMQFSISEVVDFTHKDQDAGDC